MITVRELKQELASMHDDAIIFGFDNDDCVCPIQVIHFCHERVIPNADATHCIKLLDGRIEGTHGHILIGLPEGYGQR